jgi:hypothetical protein
VYFKVLFQCDISVLFVELLLLFALPTHPNVYNKRGISIGKWRKLTTETAVVGRLFAERNG